MAMQDLTHYSRVPLRLAIGFIGEYIGDIFIHVKHVPMVIEKERINLKE